MLEAVNADLVFTISLKRSTQNLQLSTSSPADYPIFWGNSGHRELTASCLLKTQSSHFGGTGFENNSCIVRSLCHGERQHKADVPWTSLTIDQNPEVTPSPHAAKSLLGVQRRERATQGLAGNHHEACEWLTELENQEDRSRCRKRENPQGDNSGCVVIGEQAETCQFRPAICCVVRLPLWPIRFGVRTVPHPERRNRSRRARQAYRSMIIF